MKITQLTIDNIRSHAHTELPMDRLTIIRGANHSGKSTISQAMEFLFTGRCDVTDSDGKGHLDLLRHGAEKASVAATFDGMLMRATLNKSAGRQAGIVSLDDKGWNGQATLNKIGCDRNILSCLCNTRYFVSAPPKAQKALLASMILPEEHDFAPEVRATCDAAGIPVNWALSPFLVIEDVYKQAFAARTLLNRDIKQHRLPEVPPLEGSADPAAVRTRLRELQEKRTKLALDRERALRAFENEEIKAAAVAADYKNLSARLVAEQQAQEASASQQLPADTVKALTKVAAQSKAAKKLEEDLAIIAHALKENGASLDALENLNTGGACPTCLQALTEEAMTAVGRPLIEKNNKLILEQREKWDARKALGDYEGAAAKLEASKQAQSDHKAISAKVEELTSKLKAAEKAVAGFVLPAKPDTTAMDEEILALEKKIESGTELLYKVAQHEQLSKQLETAKGERDTMATQLARLEKLCAYFGPADTGIKAQLIARHIGSFQSGINRTLEQWGYFAELQLEPYGFTLSRPFEGETRGVFLELHQLSESERYRFSVAFQVALAIQSGYKFVVVDAADVLDTNSEKALYRTLYTSALDQAIVLSTDTEHTTNGAPGAIFYALVQGNNDETLVSLRCHNPVREEVVA